MADFVIVLIGVFLNGACVYKENMSKPTKFFLHIISMGLIFWGAVMPPIIWGA